MCARGRAVLVITHSLKLLLLLSPASLYCLTRSGVLRYELGVAFESAKAMRSRKLMGEWRSCLGCLGCKIETSGWGGRTSKTEKILLSFSLSYSSRLLLSRIPHLQTHCTPLYSPTSLINFFLK
ncbi:MAG: hypothetical protein ACKERG_01225 [Candidatus Hodgkinia cicadicola]